MITSIKTIIRPLVRFLRLLRDLNWYKTLYLNLKSLPLNKAMCFPIYVYGRLDVHSLNGEILIEAPIKSGMIKIGYKKLDLLPISYLPSQLLNEGTLIFRGPAIISGGVSLSINGGLLDIGSCCIIGGGGLVKSTYSIKIGANTRIAYGCIIFDSNMHYVKEIETGVIKKNNGPILIGESCWINGQAYISKNAVVPDYSILARNSWINKDFSKFGTNLFLVGAPAKALDTKVQRIFSTEEEKCLSDFFDHNPNANEFLANPGLFDDVNDTFKSYF